MVISSEYPKMFTKLDPRTGQVRQRSASSPGQAVQLKFNGWREKVPDSLTSHAAGSAVHGGKAAVKATGKPVPERKES